MEKATPPRVAADRIILYSIIRRNINSITRDSRATHTTIIRGVNIGAATIKLNGVSSAVLSVDRVGGEVD